MLGMPAELAWAWLICIGLIVGWQLRKRTDRHFWLGVGIGLLSVVAFFITLWALWSI